MRTVTLTIQDVAFGGKGIGRDGGKAVFVPYTIDGETISAEIVREKKKFAEAELGQVLTPSPHRVPPACPYFGECGGCAYQHIAYPHQLELKAQQVRSILQRIGKLGDVIVNPIVPSPRPYQYRNRITVHAADGTIGFFRRDSHRLIDVERCPIAVEAVNAELAELRSSNPRDGHYTLRAHGGPRIFFQTNDDVAEALRNVVSSIIGTGQDLLIDAYCGAGFFAKALLDRFQRIIGIDWDRFAVEEAVRSATEKESYFAGDVAAELERIAGRRKEFGTITIILDPPATGLSEDVRRQILNLAADAIVYVSCNPATLARDLSGLKEAFTIESVTPFDMFPQTAEIESVAHMSRLTQANI